MGYTLCDNCNGTSLKCNCKNYAGEKKEVTLVDMSESPQQSSKQQTGGEHQVSHTPPVGS